MIGAVPQLTAVNQRFYNAFDFAIIIYGEAECLSDLLRLDGAVFRRVDQTQNLVDQCG